MRIHVLAISVFLFAILFACAMDSRALVITNASSRASQPTSSKPASSRATSSVQSSQASSTQSSYAGGITLKTTWAIPTMTEGGQTLESYDDVVIGSHLKWRPVGEPAYFDIDIPDAKVTTYSFTDLNPNKKYEFLIAVRTKKGLWSQFIPITPGNKITPKPVMADFKGCTEKTILDIAMKAGE